MRDETGRDLEFVQQRGGGLADLGVPAVAPAEAEGARPEAVAERVVREPALPHQLVQDPVRGGARQPGAAGDVLQRQPGGGPVERIEDQGHPLDHRRRRLASRGRTGPRRLGGGTVGGGGLAHRTSQHMTEMNSGHQQCSNRLVFWEPPNKARSTGASRPADGERSPAASVIERFPVEEGSQRCASASSRPWWRSRPAPPPGSARPGSRRSARSPRPPTGSDTTT